MTSIPKTKQEELVLLNGKRSDILSACLLTAVIVILPIAAFLILAYLDSATIPYVSGVLAALFLLTFSSGFLMSLEYRLINNYRLTSSFPLFATASFVVWAVTFFGLYLGNPNFLGFRGLISAFFVFPLLVTFVVAFFYAVLVRRLFFQLLTKRVSFDYIELYYRGNFLEKLSPIWESIRRYGGKLTLFCLRLSYEHKAESKRGKPDTETISIVDQVSEHVRKRIRGSDETGMHTKNILWIILYRTGREEAEIPKKRLLKEIESAEALAAVREQNKLKVEKYSLKEMTEDEKTPAELIEKALEELD